MYSARGSSLAVAVLFLSNLSGTVAFPQAVKFIGSAADPLPLSNLAAGRASCARDSKSASAPYAATGTTGDANAPCDAPPLSAPSVNGCNSASPAQIGCDAPRDPVQEDLAAMGKPGQKILHARDRVLEMLQTENACSAWFREKDSNADATFRTLSFEVDRQSEEFVQVSKNAEYQTIFRDPYVAKVGQDTGTYATITLNPGGAFFRGQAPTRVVSMEGGLSMISKARVINVGPYAGNSAAAQTLAMLHEFGHVLNLLPVDFDNEDGKSVQNTAEVLRFCRAEIESKIKRGAR